MKSGILISVIIALLLVYSPAYAQEETDDDIYLKAEKLLLTPRPGFEYHDSEYIRELELERRRRSPTGALLRSLAVPGWGQFYNGEYVKGPIVIAAQATCVYFAIDRYLTARDYYDQSRNSTDDDERATLYGKYNDYLVETEFWGWLFVGFMALSAMDAYVDAHLSDWDVEDLPKDDDAPKTDTKNGAVPTWDLAFGTMRDGTPSFSIIISPF
jgi:TM2 domain-containing membrane protein YozV